MIDKFAKEAGKSLWKEVGEDVIKKSASTFVVEGIKALVDLWKTRQMKEIDLAYKEKKSPESSSNDVTTQDDSAIDPPTS